MTETASVATSDILSANLVILGTVSHRGTEYQLIHEVDAGLVWLDCSSEWLTWNQSADWAAEFNTAGELAYNLNPGVNVQWHGPWRLPVTGHRRYEFGYDGANTAGFNDAGSELGHLFYRSLGNLGYQSTDGRFPQPGNGLRNTGPFKNLLQDFYWSEEYPDYPSSSWFFGTQMGYQGEYAKDWPFNRAIAVRPATITSAALTPIGSATYRGRDYQLIYDEDQGLIWLDYNSDFADWRTQTGWAASLSAPDELTYHLDPGVTVEWRGDWRLPQTTDGPYVYGFNGTTNAGYNNRNNSEWAHLYYTSLGKKGLQAIDGSLSELPPPPAADQDFDFAESFGLAGLQFGPFQNLKPEHYWCATEYADHPAKAWYVITAIGYQGVVNKGFYFCYAMAVRPGVVRRARA
jgi:hypothetical protein